MQRRTFLKTMAMLTAASLESSLLFATPAKKLKFLILGGGGFIGPNLVRLLQERGHEVTLFNRGRTTPKMFPGAETLIGDRFPDREPGLKALENKRKWDVVVDTWSGAPGVVRTTAEMLKDRAGYYLFVSTISVYPNYDQPGMTEDAPRTKADGPVDWMDPKVPYGLAKTLSEDSVVQAFGKERSSLIRPGIISGRDYSSRPRNQRVYWPLRLRRGGDVLAPGDGKDPVQYIDVKDLSAFMVHAAEAKLAGGFNLVGPEKPMSMKEYVEGTKVVVKSDSRLHWVDAKFIEAQDVRIPMFVAVADAPGFFQVSNKKSVENGLKYRPFTDTVRDILESYPESVEADSNGGPSADKEKQLLAAWQKTQQPVTGV
jgi:2'-hydroxyisoflavone reductase